MQFLDFTISQTFEMAIEICKHFYKSYSLSSILGLPGSTFSRFFFLLKDFNELSKLLVLSEHLTFAFNTTLTVLSIIKYTEKDL